uniref:Uncharacterized protein n=1 Tax=Polytomella parva TaxID=51329 RepID=A0A7S0UWE7_9CHLO
MDKELVNTIDPSFVAGSAQTVFAEDDMTLADLDLLEVLNIKPNDPKSKRPDYKFNKKIPRSKGDRGQGKFQGTSDGFGLKTGKKGGLMRIGGCAATPDE